MRIKARALRDSLLNVTLGAVAFAAALSRR